MFTKRKIILFLIVLAVMVLVKYAVGQDVGESVAWDPVMDGGMDIYTEIFNVMVFGTLVGIMSGAIRVSCRAVAARKGEYFTGDLVCLHL